MGKLLSIIILILLPPLGAFLKVGIGMHFWLNLLLTFFGYFPGLVHGIWLYTKK